MNVFRCALAITFLAAVPAAAQNPGDPCAGASPYVCLDTPEALFCLNGIYVLSTCDDIVAGAATCGTQECVGSACPEPVESCFGTRGGECWGIARLFDDDTSNDEYAHSVPCVGDNACVATSEGESCQVLPPGVSLCAPGGANSCVGDALVVCRTFGSAQAVQPSPSVIDCTSLGRTCSEESGHAICNDPTCGPTGQGTCGGGGNLALLCSDGAPTTEIDCTAFEQVCVDGRCIDQDVECAPFGLGSCEGDTANICVEGQFMELACRQPHEYQHEFDRKRSNSKTPSTARRWVVAAKSTTTAGLAASRAKARVKVKAKARVKVKAKAKARVRAKVGPATKKNLPRAATARA